MDKNKVKEVLVAFSDAYDKKKSNIAASEALPEHYFINFKDAYSAPDDCTYLKKDKNPDGSVVELTVYHWLDGVQYAKYLDYGFSYTTTNQFTEEYAVVNCTMVFRGTTRSATGVCSWKELGVSDPVDNAYAKAVKRALAAHGIFTHLYRNPNQYNENTYFEQYIPATPLQIAQMSHMLIHEHVRGKEHKRRMINAVYNGTLTLFDYLLTHYKFLEKNKYEMVL